LKAPSFLLIVDGKVVACENDLGHGHHIEALITQQGVQVHVMDERNKLIEAVHVDRGDGSVCAGDEVTPATVDEALEEVQATLIACMEHGVTLNEMLNYLISRAAEMAFVRALPAHEFVAFCLKVYEQVVVKNTEEHPPVGSA
jgi:hypothetical protein